MIKKKHLGVALILAVGCLLLFRKEKAVEHASIPTLVPALTRPVAPAPERKIIDQHKKPLNRLPSSVGYINTPAADWEEKLEQKLKEQAGDSLKSLTITKERSLIWMRDQNPLHVEAVSVSMTNKQNMQASFRALVDSQTGKVLESYDQTIFDPVDVKAEYHLNLDQREAN